MEIKSKHAADSKSSTMLVEAKAAACYLRILSTTLDVARAIQGRGVVGGPLGSFGGALGDLSHCSLFV